MVASWLWASVGLWLALPLGDRMGPYRGQPVARVEIQASAGMDSDTDTDVDDADADIGIDKAELISLVDIEPGDKVDPEKIAEILRRAHALGRFSQVSVQARRKSGAVTLRFVFLPNQEIRKLRFLTDPDGLGSAVLEAAELGKGSPWRGEHQAEVTQRLQDAAQKLGFMDARLELRALVDPKQPRFVDVEISVDWGEAARLGEIDFVGDKRLGPKVLRDALGMPAGMRLDFYALESARAQLEETLRGGGFWLASVAKPSLKDLDDADDAKAEGVFRDIEIEVNAGPRIAVVYTGCHAISAEALQAMWLGISGQSISRSLRSHVADIRAAYGALGHTEVDIEVQGFEDQSKRTLRYVIGIKEGLPTHLASIKIVGNRARDEDAIQQDIRNTLLASLPKHPFLQRMVWANTAGHGGKVSGWRRPRKRPYGILPADLRWEPQAFAKALKTVETRYRALGYWDIKLMPVETTRFENTRHGRIRRVDVVLNVREGILRKLRYVSFSGNEGLPAQELLATLSGTPSDGVNSLKPTSRFWASAPKAKRPAMWVGAPLAYDAPDLGRVALIARYRRSGYLYANIQKEAIESEDKRYINLRYKVEEGPQVVVERILIEGNRHTRSEVILARMGLGPGKVYALDQAIKDRRQISDLGVFGRVQVKLLDEETVESQKDVVAAVRERRRQPVEVSVGLSTADGPRASVSYQHLNLFGTAASWVGSLKINRQVFFDLYGDFAGPLVQAYQNYSGIEQLTRGIEREIRLGIRSRRLVQWPFNPIFRLDLLNERENTIPFSLDTGALIAGVDMQAIERLSFSLEPQLALTQLECRDLGALAGQDCSASQRARNPGLRAAESELRRAFKFAISAAWDGRDDPLSPKSGYRISLKTTYALGQLRAQSEEPFETFSFLRVEGTLAGYLPLGPLTLAMAFRGGGIAKLNTDTDVPVDERFFLGGRDTLRGYVEGTLFPEDLCLDAACSQTKDGVAPRTQGGRTFLLLKTELRLPVAQRFGVHLFLDAGNLWFDTPKAADGRLRLGLGVGARFRTPVGALSLDLGFNPNPRAALGESARQLHFSVGSF